MGAVLCREPGARGLTGVAPPLLVDLDGIGASGHGIRHLAPGENRGAVLCHQPGAHGTDAEALIVHQGPGLLRKGDAVAGIVAVPMSRGHRLSRVHLGKQGGGHLQILLVADPAAGGQHHSPAGDFQGSLGSLCGGADDFPVGHGHIGDSGFGQNLHPVLLTCLPHELHQVGPGAHPRHGHARRHTLFAVALRGRHHGHLGLLVPLLGQTGIRRDLRSPVRPVKHIPPWHKPIGAIRAQGAAPVEEPSGAQKGVERQLPVDLPEGFVHALPQV